MLYETISRTALTKTGIPVARYSINPYIGCGFGCKYCFSQFIGAFKYKNGLWGRDVWVRKNIPQQLNKELSKISHYTVFLSSSCDPYQPAEKIFGLTKKILETLIAHRKNIFIMTKSTLITRDIELLKLSEELKLNITITTDREDVRKVFEPYAPSIEKRLNIVKLLKNAGINANIFVGPVLPMNPKRLALMIREIGSEVHLSTLNYPNLTRKIFYKNHWTKYLENSYFEEVKTTFIDILGYERVHY
ncbi:MAG: radical SAM protein [Kosmotogaceae bacterium]